MALLSTCNRAEISAELANPEADYDTLLEEMGKLQEEIDHLDAWDLGYFQESDIKRVRLIRRADGYYCQFVLSCDVKEDVSQT